MAYLFDLCLFALPVLDENWEKIAATPGESVKALTACLMQTREIEERVGGPWTEQYSSENDLSQAFANVAETVATALSGSYPNASIEGVTTDVWVPLPGNRHLIHARALDENEDGIVCTLTYSGLTLSYELLVQAECLELQEA